MVLRLFQTNTCDVFLLTERILCWVTLAAGKVLTLCLLGLYFVKLLEMFKTGIGGKRIGTIKIFFPLLN